MNCGMDSNNKFQDSHLTNYHHSVILTDAYLRNLPPTKLKELVSICEVPPDIEKLAHLQYSMDNKATKLQVWWTIILSNCLLKSWHDTVDGVHLYTLMF